MSQNKNDFVELCIYIVFITNYQITGSKMPSKRNCFSDLCAK